MKIKLLSVAAALVAFFSIATDAAQEIDKELTGDTRLACEAILCLSTFNRPSECAPSLRKYYSITARRISATIRKRKKFLDLCPTDSQSPERMAAEAAAEYQRSRDQADDRDLTSSDVERMAAEAMAEYERIRRDYDASLRNSWGGY